MRPSKQEELDDTHYKACPNFILKLWKIVNDPATNDMIHWTLRGKSFFIVDLTKITKELFPRYFKHSNWASFVRQLNLYGFKKKFSLDSGNLTMNHEEVEFFHPHFIEGKPEFLSNIKRKLQLQQRPRLPLTVEGGEAASTVEKLVAEVDVLRSSQETISGKFREMKSQNELLWKEYAAIRLKFGKQQQIIEKLVHFLVAMVKNSQSGSPVSSKRKFSHLALEGLEGNGASTSGPTTTEYNHGNVINLGKGPVIRELSSDFATSPYEDNLTQRSHPGKLIQFPSSVSSVESEPSQSPLDRRIGTGKGVRRPSTRVVKVEPLDYADRNVYTESNSDFSKVDDFLNDTDYGNENPTVNFASSGTNQAYPGLNQDIDLINPNHKDEVVFTVSDIDPDIDPLLLNSVNISAVNPNVVATARDPLNFSTVNSSLRGEGKGKNIASTSSVKTWGGKKQFNSHSTEPTTSTEVVPSTAVASDNIASQVDDTQYSLDSIKDILLENNLNLDPTIFVSLFNNDSNLPFMDRLNPENNEEVLGNEVSVYNPSLYDITDALDDSEAIEGAAGNRLVSSSGPSTSMAPPKNKKLRLKVKTLPSNFEEDSDSLSTPQAIRFE